MNQVAYLGCAAAAELVQRVAAAEVTHCCLLQGQAQQGGLQCLALTSCQGVHVSNQAGRQCLCKATLQIRQRVDLHAVKHAVGIEIKVARGLPELCLGNVRGVEQVVALPKMGVLQAAMLASFSIALIAALQ